jgi:hypothetical protein
MARLTHPPPNDRHLCENVPTPTLDRINIWNVSMLRSLLFATIALLLTACGPFRPPSFDKSVSLGRDNLTCVTTLRGTWPNLPHNPIQWFVGGRTNLTVTMHSPNSVGRYAADQIPVYYAWPNSLPYQLGGLSGYLQFHKDAVDIDISQTLDGSTKPLEMNGHYAISNPSGCT